MDHRLLSRLADMEAFILQKGPTTLLIEPSGRAFLQDYFQLHDRVHGTHHYRIQFHAPKAQRFPRTRLRICPL